VPVINEDGSITWTPEAEAAMNVLAINETCAIPLPTFEEAL